MRIGTDIIEISRIAQAYAQHSKVVSRILSPNELDLFESFKDQRQIEFLAGRWCAKEAYLKALGTGMNQAIKMAEIEILSSQFGQPRLVLGPVKEGVQLSISHSETIAMATCLIELTDAQLNQLLDQKGLSYGNY